MGTWFYACWQCSKLLGYKILDERFIPNPNPYSQRMQLVLHLLPLSGASLHVADSRYFWFHHSEGDTMTVQDPGEMNLCSALWAVVAYVVADLEDMLPR